jgi:hypothetical protein
VSDEATGDGEFDAATVADGETVVLAVAITVDWLLALLMVGIAVAVDSR